MIFFTDRDLGTTFPRILSEKGIHTEKHDDYFNETTDDSTWLQEAGRQHWFAVSRDKRIRYRPNQRDAAMRAGVGLFLIIGNLPHSALAHNFAASISRIERFVEKHPRPFIAKVYQPPPSKSLNDPEKAGRVELWLSFDGWLKATAQSPTSKPDSIP